MIDKNASTLQQACGFIAAKTLGKTTGIIYDVSILSPQQAVSFLDGNNYIDKACISLNQIFTPYTTDTDNDGDMPIGYPEFLSNYGTVLTVDNELHSSNIGLGNVGNSLLNRGSNHRGIGINKETLFVGPSGEVTNTTSASHTFSGMVAGPIDMSWNDNTKKWVANVPSTAVNTEFWMGYVMDISIDAPSSMGDYEEFTTTFGICRNYDTGFSKSPSTNIFVIAVKSSGIALESSSLHMQYTDPSGAYFLPIYIGCGV